MANPIISSNNIVIGKRTRKLVKYAFVAYYRAFAAAANLTALLKFAREVLKT